MYVRRTALFNKHENATALRSLRPLNAFLNIEDVTRISLSLGNNYCISTTYYLKYFWCLTSRTKKHAPSHNPTQAKVEKKSQTLHITFTLAQFAIANWAGPSQGHQSFQLLNILKCMAWVLSKNCFALQICPCSTSLHAKVDTETLPKLEAKSSLCKKKSCEKVTIHFSSLPAHHEILAAKLSGVFLEWGHTHTLSYIKRENHWNDL